MANRLAASTSPYLQQHADNPVDWYEWGEEAFAAARARDVPLLISVGYAACHWCHVMAHESFEDDATAAFMDEHFVAVKVDREERPDVDAVYMAATQAMTGQGGWPMTVFATPDGEPFYCGTYFPPRPMGGMPSFPQVLAAMAAAWRTRRGEVDRSAAGIREALADTGPALALPHGAVLDDAAARRAVDTVEAQFDRARGGFGGAPRFPPSMLLEWLLRHAARSGALDADADSPHAASGRRALAMAGATLEAMARGGMYDQLAGGFARYSVDADWVVPHFEKMLYDNALLLRVYAHWFRATGSPLARRVVEETATWLLDELRTPEGGFASALDADSPGADGRPSEGAFSVWSPAQLTDVLGPDDGAWAAQLWDVTPTGTFEHGTSVLQLRSEPDDAVRYASVRARAAAARGRRPRPALDAKVVAAWNGLAVAALADAGVILERRAWVEAATTAAELLVRVHLTRGPAGTRLARTSRDGVAGQAPGVLEDYADVAEGLLALFSASGDTRWVGVAQELLDAVLDRFADGSGGFFDTADDQTDAVLARIRRPRDPADGPTPSGQAAAAGALVTLAALTGSARHRDAAERALTEPLLLAQRHPRAAGWALAVAEALLDGPREVAVVGPRDDPATRALLRAATRATAPGAVVAFGDAPPDARAARTDADTRDRQAAVAVPLLADRPTVDGLPTAYVCRGFVCERPTTDAEALARQLRAAP